MVQPEKTPLTIIRKTQMRGIVWVVTEGSRMHAGGQVQRW